MTLLAGDSTILTPTVAINKVAYQYAAPSTGQTVTMAATADHLILEPSGALLALTVKLPASPTDGQVCQIFCATAITTLTLQGGGAESFVGGLAAFLALGFARYLYRASNTTWYRCG